MSFLDSKLDDAETWTPGKFGARLPVGDNEVSLTALYTKKTESGPIIVVEGRIDRSNNPKAVVGSEFEQSFHFNGTKDWQKKQDIGRWVGFLRALVPNKKPSEVQAKFLHRHDAAAGETTPARDAVCGLRIGAQGMPPRADSDYVEIAWSPVEQDNDGYKANRNRLKTTPAVIAAAAPKDTAKESASPAKSEPPPAKSPSADLDDIFG